MYDHVTARRRPPVSLLVWVLAAVLLFGAVMGTIWVLSRDVSGQDAAGQASAGASASAAPSPTQASPVSAPASPAPSPTPSAPPPEPAPVTLQGVASGRCLDVPGGVAADGAALQIYDCNGSAAQQWTASAAGELRVLGTLCLDDPSGGQQGTAAQVWTCHGGANQQWAPQADGTVRNAATGLCLDVSNALTDNGTPAIMYGCHGGDNQRWTVS
ncbi:RICIN domain-containing protein [Promicromonospora sp. NPDC090134]|uniref:RICIN domain-containing protein n=1 Tax=Promicromonospora sp. NPDC090134 TaxID=3364408 RepID=UPI0038083A5F